MSVQVVKLSRRQRRWLEEVVRDTMKYGVARRRRLSQMARVLEGHELITTRWSAPAYGEPITDAFIAVEILPEGLSFIEKRLAASYLLGIKLSEG